MNEVERIFQQADSPAEYVRGYLAHVQALLEQLDADVIADLIDLLERTRQAGGTVHLLGNGGSAATASHFANDLLALPGEPALRVWCLADSAPVLTARGNDHGYDQVFVRQLQGRLRRGDLVIALSASGRSPNVLAAVELARQQGVGTVGLCGFDGGRLAGAVNLAVVVRTPAGEYGPVEALHSLLGHVVANYLALRGAAPT